jgi:hypothetical protein
LVADRGIAVDQNQILAFDSAPAAMHAVPRFTQQPLGADLNVHASRCYDQFV